MNIFLILIFLLLQSCSHLKHSSDTDIDNYCQKLNVLYTRIEVIASNSVNVNTTRTSDGGFYKKKIVKDCKAGFCTVVDSLDSPILKYEPKSPDANKNGYVAYPNIILYEEQEALKYWEKVFITVMENSPVDKNFFYTDPRAKICFEIYPKVKEKFDFSNYLGL